ncbi:GLPGLI family protein [Soonwooa purpurea]
MNNLRKHLIFFTFFLFNVFFSQTDDKKPLIADFTYLLKAKINKSTPNYIHEELFSLQVLKDQAFFISDKALKFDSIFQSEYQKATIGGSTNTDFRGKTFPKTKFRYTIIQSNKDVQYFERVGMTLLAYKEPTIENWKLINESKIIDSFNCKKAVLNYKGREWTAWYSTDIPLSYGPYKFTGLPGLIIKISDEKGDYSFEIVKSVSNDNLKGKFATINKLRYENAKEITLNELNIAKKNANSNLAGSLANSETIITSEGLKNLRDIQKQRQQNLKNENPIELIE